VVQTNAEALEDRDRRHLLLTGLWLSLLSILWGVGSGAWAITSALGSHSLAVLGLGLNLAADVSGSIFVGWRLWSEFHGAHEPERAERVASLVVGCALGILGVFLVAEAVVHLASRYHSNPSNGSLAAAAASLAVLAPLGLSKRRVGRLLSSAALCGDGSLSLLGAAVASFALLSLILDSALGWWWADAVAALIVACCAAIESTRTLRGVVL
jgi:divalent metal cation (Fe/Co/Zn/Cd) transporter